MRKIRRTCNGLSAPLLLGMLLGLPRCLQRTSVIGITTVVTLDVVALIVGLEFEVVGSKFMFRGWVLRRENRGRGSPFQVDARYRRWTLCCLACGGHSEN